MSTITAQLEVKEALRKHARAFRRSPDPAIGVAAGQEELRLQGEIDKLRKKNRGKNGRN